MSPLALYGGAGVLALLALFALRGKRWAYLGFVLLGLLYFPAQAHFHVHLPKCEQILPTMQQLVPLLQNYVYVALFAGFYWMSWVQLRDANARGFWALVVTLLGAALFEIAEGMTGGGVVAAAARTVRHAKAIAVATPTHCRVQDLVPAVAGALGAAVLLAVWARLRRKPAYVRLGKPRSAPAPAPRPAAPPPRPVIPARAVLYDPPAYAPPPPPPDFSPGPTPTAATPPAEAEPTQEVARTKKRLEAILARLQLQKVLGRLTPVLQRFWSIIRRRRRAIVVGVVLLAVVGAGALFVVPRVFTPVAVVTEQPPPPPPEPPPPPPRPLQSEIEGYYEPNYKFTVSDRRFTRVTLRPEASLTFARFGTRQEVGCADARISQSTVFLRCDLEAAGLTVTIDGRFASRYASNRLDMPALSALITVKNTRGEIVYRARDSFLWHVPDPSQ